MGVLAVFSASDALVAVALISALAAMLGPVVVLLVSSLKGIRQAAEQAAHNTQSNGAPDTPPSAYDELVSSNEYMIGQLHAAVHEAHEASRAAWQLQAAIKQNDVKTDALAARVEEEFEEAKRDRGLISLRLDANTERLERNISDGATFVAGAGAVFADALGRLDALDGGDTRRAMLDRIEAQRGREPGDPPPTVENG